MLSKQDLLSVYINAVEFLTVKSVDGLTILMEHLLSLKGLDKNEDVALKRREAYTKELDQMRDLFVEPEPNTYEKYYGDAVDDNGNLVPINVVTPKVVVVELDESPNDIVKMEQELVEFVKARDAIINSNESRTLEAEKKLREKYPYLDNGFRTPHRGGPPPKAKESTNALFRRIEKKKEQ